MTRAVAFILLAFAMQAAVKYPDTRKDPIVDEHFGLKIADPYRSALEPGNKPTFQQWLTETHGR